VEKKGVVRFLITVWDLVILTSFWGRSRLCFSWWIWL